MKEIEKEFYLYYYLRCSNVIYCPYLQISNETCLQFSLFENKDIGYTTKTNFEEYEKL